MDQEHNKKSTKEDDDNSNTSNVTVINNLKNIIQEMTIYVENTIEENSLNGNNTKQDKSKDKVLPANESKKLNIIMEDNDEWEVWDDADFQFYEIDKIELNKSVEQFNETNKKELNKTDGQVANYKLIPEAYNNSVLVDNTIEIYKHDDVKKLFDTVDQWDIWNKNRYNRLHNFDCVECNFKTIKFDDWKYHIMSINHMTNCYDIANFYSYICFNKNCKILLYGSDKSLNKHMKDKHDDNFIAFGISNLMKEVMKRYIYNNRKPLYFCSHCLEISDTPIHFKNIVFSYNSEITTNFYCETCKVTFISTPDMIDYHSLSVEHITIKCFDKFGTTVKTIPKEIIPYKLSNVQNELLTDKIKMPKVLLNRFKDISRMIRECKFCDTDILWNVESIINHLICCEFHSNLTVSNETNVNIFTCAVCNIITNNINDHKAHITSYLHLANCQNTDYYYSYICNMCNEYIYGCLIDIFKHGKQIHMDDYITRKIPLLFFFMAKLFGDINENPNNIKMVEFFGEKEKIGPSTVAKQCDVCKIKFYHINDYNMHEITSEHIILNFATSKKSIKYTNTSENSYEQPTKPLSVEKSSVLEDHNYLMLKDDKIKQNIPVKNIAKYQIDEDDFAFFYQTEDVHNNNNNNNNNEPQEIFNDIEPVGGENYNDSKLWNTKIDVRSNPINSKAEYKKYFVEKMDIRDVLKRKFKSFSVQHDISYYCNVCDKLEADERSWTIHYQTFHLNDNAMPTIYCISCNLYIYGCIDEDHSNSIEHCDYLQLLNVLTPEKDN